MFPWRKPIPYNTSIIERFFHARITETLIVDFKDGYLLTFHNVSAETYLAFLAHPNQDDYLVNVIQELGVPTKGLLCLAQ